MPVDRIPRIIPVLDLMDGHVVRGQGGERHGYRPIVSALCRSSDPVTVAQVLVDHCAASELYVADLDALTGGAAQAAVLRDLLGALPVATELWVDGGFGDPDDAAALIDALGPAGSRVVPVYGSESLRSRAALARCFGRGAANAVLSLDRKGGERLDPADCWDAPELWPQRLVVMTLERVGSGQGPDLQVLARVRERVREKAREQAREQAPSTTLVGAGGIRSIDDLRRAGAAGAAAWLVASALHDLQIPRIAR
ncbi:MAG: HisA/HisF-related TIM barrel protein [Rubrivivax sp.]